MWVSARDPGLDRGRGAVRSVVGAALGGGLAYGVLHLAGAPGAPAMIGGVVAMMGSQLMPQSSPQKWHFVLLSALCAGVSAALAALVAPWLYVSGVVMVAVMGIGAMAMRWAPLGGGLGFLIVMAHVMVGFLGAKPADMPWFLLSAVCGAAALGALSLLPTAKVQTRLARYVRALQAQLEALVRTAQKTLNQHDVERARRAMIEASARVQEGALRIDAALDGVGEEAVKLDVERIRACTLRVELEAEQLAVQTFLAVQHDRGRAPLREALHASAPHTLPVRLDEALTQLQRALAAPAPEQPAAPIELEAPEQASLGHSLEEMANRKALQLVISGALALIVGHLLSPRYWLYAVIGAVVVVLSPPSRGAALRRAIERAVGTAIGVVFGVGATLLLAGNSRVELALIVVMVVAAFWALPSSYVTAMALFSVMVGLLYDVMGRFTPQLLLLRLWETIAGATLGALGAMVLMPLSTRRSVDAELVDGLAALSNFLGELERTREPMSMERVRRHLRAISKTVAELRAVTRPLSSALPNRHSNAASRDELLLIGAQLRTRELIARLSQSDEGALAPLTSPQRDALSRLNQELAALIERISRPERVPATEVVPRADAFTAPDDEVGEALYTLHERLDAYNVARWIEAQ